MLGAVVGVGGPAWRPTPVSGHDDPGCFALTVQNRSVASSKKWGKSQEGSGTGHPAGAVESADYGRYSDLILPQLISSTAEPQLGQSTSSAPMRPLGPPDRHGELAQSA